MDVNTLAPVDFEARLTKSPRSSYCFRYKMSLVLLAERARKIVQLHMQIEDDIVLSIIEKLFGVLVEVMVRRRYTTERSRNLIYQVMRVIYLSLSLL